MEKENLRIMSRCLIWTSKWIVTSWGKSNIQKQQQAWEYKIMSTALDRLSFRCLRDIKVICTRQLDIWSSAQEGDMGWKRDLEVINNLSRACQVEIQVKVPRFILYPTDQINMRKFLCKQYISLWGMAFLYWKTLMF